MKKKTAVIILAFLAVCLCSCSKSKNDSGIDSEYVKTEYNVPLVKTQMKKIIVTAKTLYSHPKNVSKIYAALHTDLAW